MCRTPTQALVSGFNRRKEIKKERERERRQLDVTVSVTDRQPIQIPARSSLTHGIKTKTDTIGPKKENMKKHTGSDIGK